MARRGYAPEFRRRVVDLVEGGRKVCEGRRRARSERADDLHVAPSGADRWRIETSVTTSEQAELAAAKRRIRELETELAVHRRAAELLKESVRPKGGSRRSR